MESLNEPKFREMILYIASSSAEDEKFGAVKLNKILYYADFIAYRRLGHSISGAEYQHLSERPAPRCLVAVRQSLVDDGSASIEQRDYFNNVQQRLVPQRSPDLDQLDEKELEILDEVINELRPLSATEVSELSHGELGWRLTKDGETIPYRTAWLSSQPLSLDQIETGKEIARLHGLIAE